MGGSVYMIQGVNDLESSIRWDMSTYRIISLTNNAIAINWTAVGAPISHTFRHTCMNYAFRGATVGNFEGWAQAEIAVVNGAGETQTLVSQPFFLKN